MTLLRFFHQPYLTAIKNTVKTLKESQKTNNSQRYLRKKQRISIDNCLDNDYIHILWKKIR